MSEVRAPRLMIAATASGGGKTTITCGLLWALRRRGLRLAACKCGPDYIDPTFHEQVLGTPSRNLDLFLGSPQLACWQLAEGAHAADLTLIEGVMGYYDGIAASERASTYDVARATHTPVALVVDGRGRALSAAAEVAGFASLRTPSMIAGVIVNRVSRGYAPTTRAMIERETGLPVLGCLPSMEDVGFEHRHLGLVDASLINDLQTRVAAVADQIDQSIDLDALLALAQGAPTLPCENPQLPAPCTGNPVVAVARDEAFSFYYRNTLDTLERLGARLVPFSPLRDQNLPVGCSGLYLGGGYPELHAQALSANASLRKELRRVIAAGMPTIAECGGFMYLHETLEDAQGSTWPMVGAVPGRTFGRGGLVRFGYATLTAIRDSLLASTGERLRVHEFHYWDSTHPGDAFHASKEGSERSWDCVVATPTLHAGFPHLCLHAQPVAAKRFVDACAAYAARQGSVVA